MKTSNGGGSWKEISPSSGGAIQDVVVDPVVPSTIYAASESGIFRSADSGQSWEMIRASAYGAVIAAPAYEPQTPRRRAEGQSRAGRAEILPCLSTWSMSGTLGKASHFPARAPSIGFVAGSAAKSAQGVIQRFSVFDLPNVDTTDCINGT